MRSRDFDSVVGRAQIMLFLEDLEGVGDTCTVSYSEPATAGVVFAACCNIALSCCNIFLSCCNIALLHHSW